MHAQLIFTLGSWLHQGCGRSRAGASQSCWPYLILDIREAWDGEGRHRRTPSHCSCTWCKSWGATAPVQHFSYQCSARSLPCTQSIYSPEISRISKFPFFSKLPPERESSSQLRVSLSQWDWLSMSCAVVAAHWGLAGHWRDGVPLSTCTAGKLQFAIRSPPNLFLVSVFEGALEWLSNPLKKAVEPLFSLSLLPPLLVPASAFQTWLASAVKSDLPQHPGSGVRNSPVCWGRSAFSTL